MPYRTLDEKIDGVVITFFNITDLKEVEVKLRETEQLNIMLLNTATDVIIKLSTDWKILEINPAAEKYLGKKQKDILNKNYIHLFIPESTRKETENEMNRILKESSDTRFKMQIRTSGGKIDEADWSVIVLLDNYKSPCGLKLSLEK